MTNLTILDVGHGNCAVVRNGRRALVIDAGPGTGLLEYLVQTGVTEIDEVLISHTDSDHLRGLQRLLDESSFRLGRVRLNSDAAQKSELWQGLAFSLDYRRKAGSCELNAALTEGESIHFGARCHLQILAPRPALVLRGPGSTDDQGRRITSNTISAVCRLEMPSRRVLLTGDLDDVGLDHLISSGQDLTADVLVFPHHGGNVRPNATAEQNRAFAHRLLEAVDPTSVVFSFGRSQRRNPRPEIVSSIRSRNNCKILCTQMAFQCSTEETFEGGHLADIFASGRRRKQCCAGSVLLTESRMYPSASDHTAFVSMNAPDSLCIGPYAAV